LFLDSPASALVYGCAVALLGTGFTLVHVSSDFPHLGLAAVHDRISSSRGGA